MLHKLRKMISKSARGRRVARVPDGERYHVIGDIHGRLDLLEAMIEAIEEYDRDHPGVESTVIFLGDLIDRGPDSRGVIKAVMKWSRTRKVRTLAGNHEEMFLDSFEDEKVLRHFMKHGGRETIFSYGLEPKDFRKASVRELQKALHRLVPDKHRKFLEGLEDIIIAGDYVFVHAGLNPKRAIDDQKRSDLRWIRERFLQHREPFSHVVVHGHTIFEEIETTEHRIGIDTGAFRTGRLTALVLENDSRITLQAAELDGDISITKGELT